MKTEAKVIYRVSSLMNDDVELFDLKNDVDEYIDKDFKMYTKSQTHTRRMTFR